MTVEFVPADVWSDFVAPFLIGFMVTLLVAMLR